MLPKIFPGIAHDPYQVEKALRQLTSELNPTLFTGGNQYFVIKTSHPRYADFVNEFQDQYADGSTRIYTNLTDAYAAAVTSRGDRIWVAPGFYQETAQIVLSKNDVQIFALGLPEDTVLFGTTDAWGNSDFDLLKITGNNNWVHGLGLFTYKNDKASILFDDTGGAATASFNRISGCYFSPQAADGQGYGIKYLGGNVNWIHNNIFEATKTAAIEIAGQVGNPVRNLIQDNEFIGTGDQGIHIKTANYQTRIIHNYFTPGSQSGYNMTKGIIIDAGMNAGDVMYAENIFNLAAADVITDNKAGGTVNDKAKLNNYYLA